MINKVIIARPATKLLAKLYQLYMVENQCALMLINQSHGVVEATVKAYHTIYNAAQTVVLKIYLLPASTLGSGLLSSSRELRRICHPSPIHKPIVSTVQTVKNVGLRNPLLPSRIGSPCGVSQ